LGRIAEQLPRLTRDLEELRAVAHEAARESATPAGCTLSAIPARRRSRAQSDNAFPCPRRIGDHQTPQVMTRPPSRLMAYPDILHTGAPVLSSRTTEVA